MILALVQIPIREVDLEGGDLLATGGFVQDPGGHVGRDRFAVLGCDDHLGHQPFEIAAGPTNETARVLDLAEIEANIELVLRLDDIDGFFRQLVPARYAHGPHVRLYEGERRILWTLMFHHVFPGIIDHDLPPNRVTMVRFVYF